jgi:hypothetical protein
MYGGGEKGKMPVFGLWIGVLGVVSSSRHKTCSFSFALGNGFSFGGETRRCVLSATKDMSWVGFGSSITGERGGVISVELEYWESPANRDENEEDPEEPVQEPAGKARKGEELDIERAGEWI